MTSAFTFFPQHFSDNTREKCGRRCPLSIFQSLAKPRTSGAGSWLLRCHLDLFARPHCNQMPVNIEVMQPNPTTTKTNHNCNLGLSPHTSPNTLYAPLKVLRWLFFLTLLVASPGQVGGRTLDRAVATWKHCSEWSRNTKETFHWE